MKVLSLFDDVAVKVTENGEIYSLDHDYLRADGRPENRKGKLLKAAKDKDGYYRVCLTRAGKRKNYFVHRLVAMAYIPNCDNKPTVNHINGIKTDNRVSNLEWATHKEQKAHSIENGLCIKNIQRLQEANAIRSCEVEFEGRIYKSIREASRLTGRSQTMIRHHGKKVAI